MSMYILKIISLLGGLALFLFGMDVMGKALEDETDRYQDALGSYLVKLTGQQLSDYDNRLLNTLLYSLSDIERAADHCSNVAVEMLQVAEGKMDAHEYLNALKSGQLRESAKFTEMYRTFRQRYRFEEEAAG